MVSGGQWVFGFVDLAGFTALTEAHGDQTAAKQAERFYELARQSLAGSCHLVKQIGDAVLLAADSPADAISTVVRIADAVDRESNAPLVRAGLHFGTAVRSLDGGRVDYLGSGVNVAARVTAQASGRQNLLTETVTSGLEESTWLFRALGHIHLRNVPRPIEVVELVRQEHDGDIDPMCQMRVTPSTVIGSLRHGGIEYVFCSLGCVHAFATDPNRYVLDQKNLIER